MNKTVDYIEPVSLTHVIKNPFSRIHKEAMQKNGELSDEERNQMMKECIEEVEKNLSLADKV